MSESGAKPKHRSRTAAASACIFLAAIAGWWTWAAMASNDAAPGLLDDGTYIETAARFTNAGFIKTIDDAIEDTVVRWHRMELPQTVVLGVYHRLFGLRLEAWYLSQFALCFLSAMSIALVLWRITRSAPTAFLGASLFLFGSSVAEAVRGNFGKLEPVFVFYFAAGLATWSFSFRSRAEGPAALGAGWAALARRVSIPPIAMLLFALGSATKESGLILSTAAVITAVIMVIWSKRRKLEPYPGALLFLMGLAGLAASIAQNLSFSRNTYGRNYFKMDFSPEHVLDALEFYLLQAPDWIAQLLIGLGLVLAFLWRSASRGRWDSLLLWLAVGGVLSGAGAYLAALTGFRFSCTYYLYPAALPLALGVPLALRGASAAVRGVLTAVLVAGMAYGWSYSYLVARSQAYWDRAWVEAIEASAALGGPAIVVADFTEDRQLIQEWNRLRDIFPNLTAAPPAFGEYVSEYSASQDNLRPATTERKPADGAPFLDDDDELLLLIDADTKVGHLAARNLFWESHDPGVNPLAEYDSERLEGVDYTTLSYDPLPGDLLPDREVEFAIFRQEGAPRYQITGTAGPGLIAKEAVLHVLHPEEGVFVRLCIALPPDGALVAVGDGLAPERLDASGGRFRELWIPLSAPGKVQLKNESADGQLIQVTDSQVLPAHRRPQLRMSGVDPDRWANKAVSLHNDGNDSAAGTLWVEALEGIVPFPLTVVARSGQGELARLEIPAAGTYSFPLKVPPGETVSLTANKWGKPAAPETRELSYRILHLQEEGSPDIAINRTKGGYELMNQTGSLREIAIEGRGPGKIVVRGAEGEVAEASEKNGRRDFRFNLPPGRTAALLVQPEARSPLRSSLFRIVSVRSSAISD